MIYLMWGVFLTLAGISSLFATLDEHDLGMMKEIFIGIALLIAIIGTGACFLVGAALILKGLTTL